jgi:uncharacterized LabA/DUF88 family protein
MTIISNNRNDKVMMFIDIRNVMKSVDALEASLFKLDFYALARQLAGPRALVAAYVFDSKMVYGDNDQSRRFHDYLRYLGFRVIARDSYDSNRKEQKEVDVAMACEMVVHALRDHYDVAIVVSGDRDFVPAIQHVQSAGKRVEVAAFANAISEEMKRSADKYYELEKMPLLSMSNPIKSDNITIVQEVE